LGIKLLQALLAEEPGYFDATGLLERAQREENETRQRAVKAVIDDALKREPSDPVGALRELQKAAEAFDSPEMRKAAAGLRDRNRALAERSIPECNTTYAFKEYNEALSCYQRVAQLLPDSHPRRREVEDRIRELREIR
jgi:hypothetical protein